MLSLVLVIGILAAAALLVRPWNRPSPKHEFMLDLYGRALGDSDESDAGLAATVVGADRIRRAG